MAERKGVEIARVGKYQLSTGAAEFTPELLQSAAQRAQSAGAAYRAPLKLGHTDPRNDGNPAFGWLHNLRVETDGVLRGDIAGMPQWMADNPNAYPDRSLEGTITRADDGTATLDITALALLGETPPGISDLASWRELPALIAASADLSVMTFAAAYQAVRDTPTPAEPPVITPSTQPKGPTMSDAILSGLRERFGIAEGVSDEDFLAAVDAARDPDVTPEIAAKAFASTPDAIKTALAASAGTPAVPAGSVVISETLLASLKDGAEAGIAARAAQLVLERDNAVETAFRTGKISAARKADWVKRYDIDPDGAKADLASLPVVFPVAASGASGDGTEDIAASTVSDEDAQALASFFGTSAEAFNV